MYDLHGVVFAPLTLQVEDEVLGRAESGFVGLDNQGATCYLNALLQVNHMGFSTAFRGCHGAPTR